MGHNQYGQIGGPVISPVMVIGFPAHGAMIAHLEIAMHQWAGSALRTFTPPSLAQGRPYLSFGFRISSAHMFFDLHSKKSRMETIRAMPNCAKCPCVRLTQASIKEKLLPRGRKFPTYGGLSCTLGLRSMLEAYNDHDTWYVIA